MLLVDVDPQGNLTSGVGQKGKAAAGGTIYDALTTRRADRPIARPFIIPTAVDRLSLIPADRNLTGAEIETGDAAARARNGCARCSRRCATSTTTSSSTARRRSACSRSTRSSPPTRC